MRPKARGGYVYFGKRLNCGEFAIIRIEDLLWLVEVGALERTTGPLAG
jgi:hypothetical protein